MPGPTTEALLTAWERGRAEPQLIGRTLALLSIAGADAAPVLLADLTIGKRDALLLQLREEIFGDEVIALSLCGGCGERVELTFRLSDTRTPGYQESIRPLTVSSPPYEVEFRLPNSRDLLALNGPDEMKHKLGRLLERIVLRAKTLGQPIALRDLPDELIAKMESEMEAADPGAEVNLRLCCQACGHVWSALFDPGPFLWQELDAWAIRLLREVHLLARAYAWRETDILAMTPWRRHAYLEMLGA